MEKSTVVVFDLDGTLVDSLGTLWYAVNHTLSTIQGSTVTLTDGWLSRASVRSMIGDGADVLLRRAWKEVSKRPSYSLGPDFEPDFKAMRLRFDEIYPSFEHETTLYAGVEEGLARLRSLGVAMAIATNKPQILAEKVILNQPVLREYFPIDAVHGQSPDLLIKPHPDHVRRAARAVAGGAGLDRTVMVGDGINDVLAGCRAGFQVCVGVTYGFSDLEQLESARSSLESPSSRVEFVDSFPAACRLIEAVRER